MVTIVADQQFRRHVCLAEFGSEVRSGSRVGVDGVPQQCGETGAGRVPGGERQSGPDDGDDAESQTTAQLRDAVCDIGVHRLNLDVDGQQEGSLLSGSPRMPSIVDHGTDRAFCDAVLHAG
ncbi:hypothetical protein [Streptomyces sp. P9-A2]|uniref:hypothetical protein n=1 Tax=Streptomyces sp. P9-A2 TaxID=3072284 RepID=UPI002FCB5115